MSYEELIKVLSNPNATKEEKEAAIRATAEAPQAAPAVGNVPMPPPIPNPAVVPQYACAPALNLGYALAPNAIREAPAPLEQIAEPIMELGKKTHIDGVTKRGFHFSMPVDAMNDMELLEDLGRLDDDPTLLPGIIKKILGEAQKKALYEFLRDPKTGRIPIEAVSETVAEIFAAAGTAGKN